MINENKLKDELIQEYVNLQRLKMAKDIQQEIAYQETVLRTRMLILGIPVQSLELDSAYTITVILQLKENLDSNTLNMCQSLINNAFDNRCGKVELKHNESNEHTFVFEGGENERPCLEIGVFTLKDIENFLTYVEQWHWLESDPNEYCDILELFKTS